MITNIIKRPQAIALTFFLAITSYQNSLYADNTPALLGADANDLLLVDPSWLIKHIDKKDIIIIDVRPEKEYTKNHIKNAINISIPYDLLKLIFDYSYFDPDAVHNLNQLKTN